MMSMFTTRAAAAFAVALLVAAPALAQSQTDVRPLVRHVRATAEATVSASPDQARMTVAVVTQAQTAAAAAAENATKANAVLAALKSALEPAAEVKTAGYTISPVHVYPPQGGEPRITGYSAANRLAVTTNDLSRVGAAIDAATKAGANSIDGVQFTLRDDTAVQAQALSRAAALARERAGAIASGLGLTLGEVLHAEEASAVVRPMFMEAAAIRTADASTPIEAGTIEVRATVTITVRIT